MCPHTDICVLILLLMSLRILLCMCPHTVYGSQAKNQVITDMCPHTAIYVARSQGLYMCPHTVIYVARSQGLYMCPHTAIYVAWSQAKNQVITETEGLLDKDTGEAGSFYRTCLNEQVNKRDLRMPANRPANACNETYECL